LLDRNWKYRVVYALFTLPALGGFLFGYAITGASGALGPKSIADGHPQIKLEYGFGDFEDETFTSFNLLGALLGSIVAFLLGDRLGRKGIMICGGFAISLGSAVVFLTPSPGSQVVSPFVMLVLGQVIYGIGIGLAMHSAPLYIAEISPPEIRGFLVAMKEELIVLGILFGYVVGAIIQDVDQGWRMIFYVSCALGLVMGFGFMFAPETPRLLILNKINARSNTNVDESLIDQFSLPRKILTALRPDSSDNEIDQEISEVCESLKAVSEKPGFSELCRGGTIRALEIGIFLVIFQQITGQPSVLAYTPQVFRASGLGKSALTASIIVGVAKFCATGVSVLLLDKFGRKPLLIAGIVGMLSSLVVLCISFFFSSREIITVISLMLYVSSYQVGFGPITWLLQSEIFPLRTRSRAQSLAVLVNFLCNFAIGWSFVSLQNAITLQGSFLLYAVFAVASLVFVIVRVPETKGKTLEDIQSMFEGAGSSSLK